MSSTTISIDSEAAGRANNRTSRRLLSFLLHVVSTDSIVPLLTQRSINNRRSSPDSNILFAKSTVRSSSDVR